MKEITEIRMKEVRKEEEKRGRGLSREKERSE